MPLFPRILFPPRDYPWKTNVAKLTVSWHTITALIIKASVSDGAFNDEQSHGFLYIRAKDIARHSAMRFLARITRPSLIILTWKHLCRIFHSFYLTLPEIPPEFGWQIPLSTLAGAIIGLLIIRKMERKVQQKFCFDEVFFPFFLI